MWRRLVFVCHLPGKILPLKASQQCFLPLGFCCWSHLASPCLRSTVPAGSAALRRVHFILMHPFSWGLGHWHITTKKPLCSGCPQMPSQNCCLFIPRYDSRPTVDTSDWLWSQCRSHGRWHLPCPPTLGWPLLLVKAALPVAYLESDCGGEMESRPKVRSSLDATWILIGQCRNQLVNSKVISLKYPMASLHLKSCSIMQMKWPHFLLCNKNT